MPETSQDKERIIAFKQIWNSKFLHQDYYRLLHAGNRILEHHGRSQREDWKDFPLNRKEA